MKAPTLPFLFFTIFIDMLGFGILIPVLPQLLANPSSPHYLLQDGDTVRHGYFLLGLLMALFPIGQFFATPILGQLSDRYGRKPILVISVFGTSLSYILFATAILFKNIPLLLFSRFFDGMTGGNISVAQAAIADVTKPENRAKNFGIIGAAFGLGFILGPFIGGKLADPTISHWFNTTTPFWFSAALSFLNAASILLFFKETRKGVQTKLMNWWKSLHNIFHALHHKVLRPLFATTFLYTAGFTFFTTFFGVYLITRFGFTEGNIGNFFAFVGLWSVLTQVFVTKFFAKRYSELELIGPMCILQGFMLLAYFLPTAEWQLYCIVPFFAIFSGLAQVNLLGLISKKASQDEQGEVLGINASVQALAQTIPALLSGFIAASWNPSAPLLISAIVVFSAGTAFILFFRKR